MPEFQTKHVVAHSADHMFQLVSDVERYPEFVPLCTSLTVTSRTERGQQTELTATMAVGHNTLNDNFTTRVLLDGETHAIDVTYIDGPFRYLENRWRFKEVSASSCEVDFFISYAFRSALMGIALGPVFETAFRRFTKAFEERADAIYGTPKGGSVSSQT